VHPGHRRRGFGSALLEHIEAEARRRGRRVLTGLTGWASDAGSEGTGASGPEFARARGYDLALSEVQRELPLPVDEALLRRLADEAAGAHASYTLRSWAGPVPDDLLQGWAELTSTIVTEAPTGELEVEAEAVSTDAVREREAVLAKQGRTKFNTVAVSAAGEVVAYTDLATSIHDPLRAYQWGTLVHREHRGHRLGVAVKVANLRLLQRERPVIERLTTYNAEVNEHMIGVNEALGFRPVARLGDFQKRLPRGA
jgi:GNAT superfamily N-acetyltransferase